MVPFTHTYTYIYTHTHTHTQTHTHTHTVVKGVYAYNSPFKDDPPLGVCALVARDVAIGSRLRHRGITYSVRK
jgi:hypothetical protein